MQAVVVTHERPGVLARPFANLPPGLRARAMTAVLELPDEIGLISLRDLAPTVARLRQYHQLNIVSIEALAAATLLRATVYLSPPSPLLESALANEGLTARTAPSK